MANDEHSKLFSPSASARLLTCPGSAKASEGIPDQESLFAAEGHDAHALAEIRLCERLGLQTNEKIEDLTFYNREMEDYISDYVSYVLEKVASIKKDCPDAIVLIEQKVAAVRYDESLFGSTDVAIIADKVLTIIDLKYGRGVLVNAKENTQEMCYGLCAMETFGNLYDIEDINLCIFQPRLSNVSEWSLTVKELYKWADEILKPGIEKIRAGSEEFHPSRHCVFCKAKPLCKALRDQNLELAKHEFRPAFLMDDSEIEEVLDKADDFVNWINSVKEFALEDAMKGKKYDHYKLVEGRSNRKYIDETKVINVVKEAGYSPYEEKLLSVTGMQSRLGKARFEELLGNLVVKPRGKLTLVSRDDKRPEVNPASVDFMNLDD
ncbi:MAG: DUF2800 domain-containing protein [bacterium]|nr:DUF2800 domain-containing protein [bacterium]